MWTKDIPIEPTERTIVNDGFIFVDGKTRSFSSGIAEENPFKLNLCIPIIHFLKVHKEHPLEIVSSSPSFVGIYPIGEEKRMPAEVFEDRNTWDITTFLLLPYQVNEEKIKHWKVHNLDNSFFAKDNTADRIASVLYVPGHLSIHSSDVLHRYGFIPASQIQNQLFYWMVQGHRIFGFDKKHEEHEVGRFEVPLNKAREVTLSLANELERHYGEKILFEKQRRERQ